MPDIRNFVDELVDNTFPVSSTPRSAGIIERYPLNVESGDQPFVLFTKHKAQYDNPGGKVNLIPNDHVSLYMPMGFAINDQAVFETASTGVMGGVANNLINGTDMTNVTQQDFQAVAISGAESIGQAAGGVAGSAASVLPGRLSGLVGGIIGAVGGGNVATAVAQEYNKKAQVAVNPREFMLYKSPGLRNFSFRFRFIPDSQQESQAAERIVSWFRRGMYPTVAGQYSFTFPDAFQIQIRNMEGLPKLPEVFLESASVTYNPNSMSYFKHGNRPVEINLSLEFKELQPITRESVQDGF
jgi:hypothetical protein